MSCLANGFDNGFDNPVDIDIDGIEPDGSQHRKLRALYDFSPIEEGDLEFKTDDILIVIKELVLAITLIFYSQ